MKATYYRRPNGAQHEIDIVNVAVEDEQWFTENKVKVSLEEDGAGGVILYGDVGLVGIDGEPEEVIVLSQGRPCVECMHVLRNECQKFIKKEIA